MDIDKVLTLLNLTGERGLGRMAKTQAFLYQRGFESALIQPILQQLNKGEKNNPRLLYL